MHMNSAYTVHKKSKDQEEARHCMDQISLRKETETKNETNFSIIKGLLQ